MTARLQGKTALVTGSTDGVGRVVAERLASLGMTVLIHGRDAVRANSLRQHIESRGGKASVYLADLASMEQVSALAVQILHDEPRLDLLINNAGIGFGPPSGRREESKDGFELRFAVNYLAGYALTQRLKPLLCASAPARIVFCSSLGQAPIEFDDVMITRRYTGDRAYRQSKLAQILYTFDLAEELKDRGVTVNALHPATLMNTTMVREMAYRPQTSVEEGADAIMQLAVSPMVEGITGKFYNGLNITRPNNQAYDLKARARLKALSEELTGV